MHRRIISRRNKSFRHSNSKRRYNKRSKQSNRRHTHSNRRQSYRRRSHSNRRRSHSNRRRSIYNKKFRPYQQTDQQIPSSLYQNDHYQQTDQQIPSSLYQIDHYHQTDQQIPSSLYSSIPYQQTDQIDHPSIPFRLPIPYSSSPTIYDPNQEDTGKSHNILSYLIYKKTFTNACSGPSLHWSSSDALRNNDRFDDLTFEILISFITYCPHDVVVFHYVLSAKEWNGTTHANMVVVNKKSKIWEIEHFEPHGVITNDLVMQRISNASDAALKEKFTLNLNKAGIQFRYLSPIDVCPYAGPQSRMVYDVGLCGFWATWYAIVRIINSDKTAKFIQNAIFNLDPLVLQNLIQDFVNYIHQYSINPVFIKMIREIAGIQLYTRDLAKLLYNDNIEKLYRFMMSINKIIDHNPNSLDTTKNIQKFMVSIYVRIKHNNRTALDETVQNKIITIFESMDGKNIKDPLLSIPSELYSISDDDIYDKRLYKYLDDVEESIKKLPDIDQNLLL